MLGAPARALDTGDIVVTSLKGEVHVTMNGGERALRAGSVIELPATVRTGRDGSIDLRQGATAVSVGPDTQLDFPAPEIPGGSIDRIQQPRGNAFYDIGKRGSRKLRIETPFLVAVVKGTQFNVAARDEATTIALFEGRLEIRSADDSDVVDLVAGEIASRHRNDQDIGVIRMDATRPVPTAPSGAEGGDRDTTPPAAPQPDPVEQSDEFLVRDAQSAPISLDEVRIDLGTTDMVGLTAVETPEVPLVVAGDIPPGAVADGAGAASGSNDSNVPVSIPEVIADVGGAVASPPAVEVTGGLNGAVGDVPPVEVGAGVTVGGVTVDAGTGVDLGGGTVDVDVDVGIDLDTDDDGNNGHGNSNGSDGGNPGGKHDDSGLLGEIVEDVTNLLDGLRKPGKK